MPNENLTPLSEILDGVERRQGLSSPETPCRYASGRHPVETIRCQCGWSVASDVAGLSGFDVMDEEDLKRLWRGWTRERQSRYLVLLEWVKPHQTSARQAASWAALRVND